jgi:hypothetical protein
VRSSSVSNSSAYSRERSTPSDEEVDVDVDGVGDSYVRGRYTYGGYGKIEEDEVREGEVWDGMEMEMEMD